MGAVSSVDEEEGRKNVCDQLFERKDKDRFEVVQIDARRTRAGGRAGTAYWLMGAFEVRD